MRTRSERRERLEVVARNATLLAQLDRIAPQQAVKLLASQAPLAFAAHPGRVQLPQLVEDRERTVDELPAQQPLQLRVVPQLARNRVQGTRVVERTIDHEQQPAIGRLRIEPPYALP